MFEIRSNERVYVFVDVMNILEAVGEDFNRCHTDFIGISRMLSGRGNLIRPYAYDSEIVAEEGRSHKKLHNALRRDGFTVRIREIYNQNNAKQKGVDVELACDMCLFAINDLYDVAVLISGDGDYVPAVERVKDMGKKVLVASFRDCLSHDLYMAADDVWILDSVPLLRMFGINDGAEVVE